MSTPTSTITRLGLLQRIRRWAAKHPTRAFRRHRPGTANFRQYGQAAVIAQGVVLCHGTLEKVARSIGLLHEGEATVDEEAKALLIDLAGAGSPRPGTVAFDRWLKQHPEFAGRVAAVEDALAKDLGLLGEWEEVV